MSSFAVSKLNYSENVYVHLLSTGSPLEAAGNTLSAFENYLPSGAALPRLAGQWQAAVCSLTLDNKYESVVEARNGAPSMILAWQDVVMVDIFSGSEWREPDIENYAGSVTIPSGVYTMESFVEYFRANRKDEFRGHVNIQPFGESWVLTMRYKEGRMKPYLYILDELAVGMGLVPPPGRSEECLTFQEYMAAWDSMKLRPWERAVLGTESDLSASLREDALKWGAVATRTHKGNTYYRFPHDITEDPESRSFLIAPIDYIKRGIKRSPVEVLAPKIVNVSLDQVEPQPSSSGHHNVISSLAVTDVQSKILHYEPERLTFFPLSNCTSGAAGNPDVDFGGVVTNKFSVKLTDENHKQLALQAGVATSMTLALKLEQTNMSSTVIRVSSSHQRDRFPENSPVSFKCALATPLVASVGRRFSAALSSVILPSQHAHFPPNTADARGIMLTVFPHTLYNVTPGAARMDSRTFFNEYEFLMSFLKAVHTVTMLGEVPEVRPKNEKAKTSRIRKAGSPPVYFTLRDERGEFTCKVGMPEELAGSLGLMDPIDVTPGESATFLIRDGTEFKVSLNIWKPSTLNVYCNEILPSVVADTFEPILATIPLRADFDRDTKGVLPSSAPLYEMYTPKRLHFYSIAAERLDSLEFSLRTPSGQAPFFRMPGAEVRIEIVIKSEEHRF